MPEFCDRETMRIETEGMSQLDEALLRPEGYPLGIADDNFAPGNIALDKCVLFADLGYGAEQPLALDYRVTPPRVLILVHLDIGARWICLASTFKSFYKQLKGWDPT